MTWDLSIIYESFQSPAFKADFQSLQPLMDEIEATIQKGGAPVSLLVEVTRLFTTLQEKVSRLGTYAYLTWATDAVNEEALNCIDQLMAKEVDMERLLSDFSRYLGALDDLDAVIDQNPLLTEHGFMLRELKEDAAHRMDKAIESWILRLSLTGGETFAQLREKLAATLTANFRGEEIPLSAVRAKAYDPDPAVRKEAYEAELLAYPKVELAIATCLNGIKGEARIQAEARHFDSVLDWTLHDSRMDRETLEALWTAVSETLTDFRRYLKAKGRLLGHTDGIPFYDLMAPVGKGMRTYTAEEARALLAQKLGSFTPAMGAFIHEAFDNRWIDMYPRSGKQGGAFCSSVHTLDISRVLTNFAGSFADISTLAHELGHAWHNRCMAGLPILLTEHPMPLAETASIFNETLLSHAVLKTASPEEAFTIIEAELMEATQSIVDIYGRFLFESEVINTRADHALSVNELKEAMLRAQEASYGDGLEKDARHPYMWACKGHYYSPTLHFYNFPYAFGLLFAKGVFAQYLEKGESFVPTYNKLLRSCGNGTVYDVAMSVGIDVHSVDFWRSSLNVLKESMDRFVELCDKQ
jgi:pepF/M3 family oligoendopeptidase